MRVNARSPLIGPVLGQRGPFAECGKPTVRWSGRARWSGGRLYLASVGCLSTCRVTLAVRAGRQALRKRVDIETNGLLALRRHKPLRAKELRVRVIVNGRQRARRVVRVGRPL